MFQSSLMLRAAQIQVKKQHKRMKI